MKREELITIYFAFAYLKVLGDCNYRVKCVCDLEVALFLSSDSYTVEKPTFYVLLVKRVQVLVHSKPVLCHWTKSSPHIDFSLDKSYIKVTLVGINTDTPETPMTSEQARQPVWYVSCLLWRPSSGLKGSGLHSMFGGVPEVMPVVFSKRDLFTFRLAVSCTVSGVRGND